MLLNDRILLRYDVQDDGLRLQLLCHDEQHAGLLLLLSRKSSLPAPLAREKELRNHVQAKTQIAQTIANYHAIICVICVLAFLLDFLSQNSTDRQVPMLAVLPVQFSENEIAGRKRPC